jgi:hypothetical protein
MHARRLPLVQRFRPCLALGVNAFLFGIVLLAPPAAVARSGTFTVRGRVVERGPSRGIAQATVTLGEDRSAITNEQGGSSSGA